MTYAIKTLYNQSILVKDLLDKKKEAFAMRDIEFTGYYGFILSDIETLQNELNELRNAIGILKNNFAGK
jgi:hypothetical protein